MTDRKRRLNLNVRQVIYSLDWPYSTLRREFLKRDYAKAMDKVLLKARVACEAEHTWTQSHETKGSKQIQSKGGVGKETKLPVCWQNVFNLVAIAVGKNFSARLYIFHSFLKPFFFLSFFLAPYRPLSSMNSSFLPASLAKLKKGTGKNCSTAELSNGVFSTVLKRMTSSSVFIVIGLFWYKNVLRRA